MMASFICDFKHLILGDWHQYDVLLAVAGYGWETIIDWADYMVDSDLEHITQVTVGFVGHEEKDITELYNKSGRKCAQIPELVAESGILSIAGISKDLKKPMKIVWFNQTRILRFFTLSDDQRLMKNYIETVVSRTF